MSDAQQGPGWWLASDGKWYPPQTATPPPLPPQQPPYPHVPPPAASQGNGCLKWALIGGGILFVLGVAVLGCVAVVGNEVVDSINEAIGEADEDDYDIELTSCGTDEFGTTTAEGRIKNTAGHREAFQIQVRFTDADGDLLDTSSTFVDTLDDGQSTRWEVIAVGEPIRGDVDCEIREVSYSIFGE